MLAIASSSSKPIPQTLSSGEASTKVYPLYFKIPEINYSSLRSIPCTDMKFVDFCSKLSESEDPNTYFLNKEICCFISFLGIY